MSLKVNTLQHTEVSYHNGQETMEMYVVYNEKANMNYKLMCEWIRHVFKPPAPPNTTILVSVDGYETVLLLDNVKSHTRPSVLECFKEKKVNVLLLPPNCTPRHWIIPNLQEGVRGTMEDLVPQCQPQQTHTKGEQEKADNDTIKTWIAAAVAGSLTPEHIMRCFAHTLNGEKVIQEAEIGYRERQAALAAQGELATASSAREAVDSALESVLNMCNSISITARQQQHTAVVDDEFARMKFG